MGNFTNTYQDLRNLTCRPRDNLTFRKELEGQCHVHMLILLVAAFYSGMFINDNSKGHKQVLVLLEKEKSFQAHISKMVEQK